VLEKDIENDKPYYNNSIKPFKSVGVKG